MPERSDQDLEHLLARLRAKLEQSVIDGRLAPETLSINFEDAAAQIADEFRAPISDAADAPEIADAPQISDSNDTAADVSPDISAIAPEVEVPSPATSNAQSKEKILMALGLGFIAGLVLAMILVYLRIAPGAVSDTERALLDNAAPYLSQQEEGALRRIRFLDRVKAKFEEYKSKNGGYPVVAGGKRLVQFSDQHAEFLPNVSPALLENNGNVTLYLRSDKDGYKVLFNDYYGCLYVSSQYPTYNDPRRGKGDFVCKFYGVWGGDGDNY